MLALQLFGYWQIGNLLEAGTKFTHHHKITKNLQQVHEKKILNTHLPMYYTTYQLSFSPKKPTHLHFIMKFMI